MSGPAGRPSGGRGGFPVEIRTISHMINLGRRRIVKGMAALREGYLSAVGPDQVKLDDLGDPSGIGPKQTLPDTDFRNFRRGR